MVLRAINRISYKIKSRLRIEVGMFEGNYSDDKNLFTNALAECVATLLYFESHEGKGEGILTHYPAAFLLEEIEHPNTANNYKKLKELKQELKQPINNYTYKKGIFIRYKSYDEDCEKDIKKFIELIETELFPGIKLLEIPYEGVISEGILLNPKKGKWKLEKKF